MNSHLPCNTYCHTAAPQTLSPLAESNKLLSATYFIALLLALSAFTFILREARAELDSLAYLLSALWGMSIVLFSVSSFLFFSESEIPLKAAFRFFREISLYTGTLFFWWSLMNIGSHAALHHWLLIFSITATLIQLFLRFYCHVNYSASLATWAFLSAVLVTYAGILCMQEGVSLSGVAFLITGTLQFLAFLTSRGSNKNMDSLAFELYTLSSFACMYWALSQSL